MSAALLAFFSGFLSLGQEILWVRLFGFTNHSLPQAFAVVLMFYLIGIAIGARIGKHFCSHSYDLWRVSGVTLLIASFFDLVSPWIYAEFAHSNQQVTCGIILILLTALLKSILFPIAHHLGASPSGMNVGRAISRVYVANIIGATLGPIIVGMIMLDVFTTQQCYAITAGLTFLVALYCLAHLQPLVLMMTGLFAIVFLKVMFAQHSSLIAKVADQEGEIRRIVETRQGIITLYKGNKSSDTVYGGNVYDGQTNLDPIINSNEISRVIILAALQDKPERVLMIGLSIGSWLKLVTSFPGVKHIDVVEINPGYLEAIKAYPRQHSALLDSRVHVHIDDARRWLKLHADNQYELIIMNTTFHWRAYTTNLLSREFLTLMKRHMGVNAVLAFNTTESPDALKTAARLFPYAFLYKNFVIAADFDWRKTLRCSEASNKLSSLNLDGKLLFPKGSDKTIHHFLYEPIVSLNQVESNCNSQGRKVEVITDRNLITEYKYGKTL